MATVVTYQLAYLSHRHVSLCAACVSRDDHEQGVLGPVSHGAHRGACEGRRHGSITITRAQIAALRSEAGVAGDLAQVAICDRALAGDAEARRECARVIADAAAQAVAS